MPSVLPPNISYLRRIIKTEVNYTMNLAQANALFDTEAVFMYSADVVPEYRVIELFGNDMAAWPDSCCRYG